MKNLIGHERKVGMEIEPGDLEEMLKLYREDGLSIETLSQEYAYPKSLIYREFAKKGEKFHTGRRSLLETLDSDTVEKIVADYHDWVPMNAIVIKYGLGSIGAIYHLLATLRIAPRTQQKDYLEVRKQLMDEAVSMYEKNYPLWMIFEACAIDNATLYKELHHRGVKIGRKRGGNVYTDVK